MNTVRLAAVGDLHCKRTPRQNLKMLFAHASDCADVILLCGDLTDHGLKEEAQVLAEEVRAVAHKISVLAVLGNHDHQSGKQDEICQILSDVGVVILDGNAFESSGVGFTGAKGFAGGFGARSLQAWGEEGVKRFVHEAVDEALKIETGLGQLENAQRVVALHYSPIRATVEGEPSEIFPFLGSSRLEEPLNRYSVTAVFHAHAHHGSLEGQTLTGIPVYNVSMPVLQRSFPDRPPYRLVEIPVTEVA